MINLLRLLLVSISLLSPMRSPDHHARARCRFYEGTYASVAIAPPACASPVGICMHGTLAGSFPAVYDFTAETMEPANDPSRPGRQLFTGHSVITPAHGPGQLFSNDHGTIDFTTATTAHVHNEIIIDHGTEHYDGAVGIFEAHSTVDFAAGRDSGEYRAVLCVP